MQLTYWKIYLLFRYGFKKLSAHMITIGNGSDDGGNIYKKFWNELIPYFPFTCSVFDTRITQKTPRPTVLLLRMYSLLRVRVRQAVS
jgi:hypothetical protein